MERRARRGRDGSYGEWEEILKERKVPDRVFGSVSQRGTGEDTGSLVTSVSLY